MREAVAARRRSSGNLLVRVDELPAEERQLLHERHLVEQGAGGLDPQHPVRSGAAVFSATGAGVMVNEEDHSRLQALRSGFELAEAYAAIERLDDELGARVPYAFHEEFGFLTACPTNTGTGMRASVLIHLPGLVLTKEIAKVLRGSADRADVPRAVRRGERGHGQFLPDLEPDDARPSEDELH